MVLSRKELLENGFREVKEDGVHYFEHVFDKNDYENSSALVTNDVLDNVEEEEKVYRVHLMGVQPDKLLTLEEIQTLIKIYGNEA